MKRRDRRRATGALLVALALALCPWARAAAQISQAALQQLRANIVAGNIDGAEHDDLPRYRAALLRVYADSAAPLLWIIDGRPSPQASALLSELSQAELRGLDPADYDGALLAGLFHQLRTAGAASDAESLALRAEVWLTLSAVRYADHARNGRVDPKPLGFVLPENRAQPDFPAIVFALSRAGNVHTAIDSLEPPYSRFRALEQLLHGYRALSADSTLGVLPNIAAPIRPSDRWAGCASLRRLLEALGEIRPRSVPLPMSDSDKYDDDLAQGVKRFQSSRGLLADGVIGKVTLPGLRMSIASRTAQIALAMERWRWLPDPAASRMLVVNIPEFRLYALERSANRVQIRKRMDVIVGSAYNGRRTPVLASSVRHVVFHPYWDVPRSIARREEIPKIRRDPAHATREGMEIVRGGDAAAMRYPITPANLQRVIDGELRLRQRPGPRNALGAVKFVFPNAYNVYLHDTPVQSLFTQERRDFSHGCIRASDPEGLAEFVLEGEGGWERQRIQASVADQMPRTRTVTLKHPVPIFIVYATVIVDSTGTPSFLPDLYGHDAALARVLERRATRRLSRASSSVGIPAIIK